MRLVVVSDLHITDRPCRSDVSLEEQERILGNIAAESENSGVDATLVVGDLYDGKSTSAERKVVMEWLDWMENFGPVVVCRGNHDDPLDIEALRHIEGVYPFTRPNVWKHGTMRVAVAPWPTAKVENGAALYADVVRGKLAEGADVLLAHCDLVGAALDGGQESTGKVSSALTVADFGETPTFLGHYHARQQVGENAWYVGSIRQMRFGDDSAKGFGIYDTDAKSWDWFGPYGRTLNTIDWKPDLMTGESLIGPPQRGQLVRLRYTASESEREEKRALAEVWAAKQPCEVIIEPTVIADTRTRGAEVAEAKSDKEKLIAYWGEKPPARADEILRKMEVVS